MTIPTDNVSASIVSMFNVKSMYHINPNVARIDVGMAIAAMTVDLRFVRNNNTTTAARIDPTIRCSSTLLMDASMKSDWSRTTRRL